MLWNAKIIWNSLISLCNFIFVLRHFVKNVLFNTLTAPITKECVVYIQRYMTLLNLPSRKFHYKIGN